MRKIVILFVLAFSMFVFSGCATQQQESQEQQPLSADDQVLQQAKSSCLQQTMVMMGDNPGGGSVFNNLEMTAYFRWCMESKGFSKEQIDAIWY